MVEVLRDHGQPVQDMLALLGAVREASWLGGGELSVCTSCSVSDIRHVQATG